MTRRNPIVTPHRRPLALSVAALATALLLGLAPATATASPPGPTTQVTAPDPDTRCYVGLSHSVFLDRAATELEQAAWADSFASGTPLWALPDQLANSEEWLTVVVTGLYRDALDREPEPAGLDYWVGRLRAGEKVNRLGALVYGSGEFYGKAGGTDEAFVDELYTRILHRSADAAGSAYWVGRVGAIGRGSVASSFFASIESRGDRVDALYDQILGRAADPGGRSYWIDRLATDNDVRLAVLLASSGEFRNRAPRACWRVADVTVDADDNVLQPTIAGDGQTIAFESAASGLTSDADNGVRDIFVAGEGGALVNITPGGDADSEDPAISGDGGRVAFMSGATTLTGDADNGVRDVFLWERATGTTVNLTPGADDDAWAPAISADGTTVAFTSGATNLTPGDTNGVLDLFVVTGLDTPSPTITNVTAAGDANASTTAPSLTADGREVAFASAASNLVAGDTGGVTDVFVHDQDGTTTTRVATRAP
ncbi:DUF4214 domain-containing protein [Iamia majanohamensis]|uniref:DUF4214 domain-containing protein n=1 Tax=Iamia majanohamensis TaxID=467976 RepID=A0AAE9Y8U4_9ACTN|nr:DUF4214 domain-containing protein [Iamia majanohamensis]WCO66603.1 DUF4214 domain-containing protein [Iamia majanohamensis]